jgi:hypothetical protein
MGNVNSTTGSSPAETALKWGLWIGMGLIAYRLYRQNPVSWEANPEHEDLVRVCSWCKRMFVEGKWVPGDPQTDFVTHTICDPCAKKYMREIETDEKQEY